MRLWLLACEPALECDAGYHEEMSRCVPDSPPELDLSNGEDPWLQGFPPVVVHSSPGVGALSVDPTTTRLEVTFSRAMASDRWSWVQADLHFPTTGEAGFVDDDTAFLEVTLEPDSVYYLWLNAGGYTGFANTYGQAAVPWPLVFSTGDDPSLLDAFPIAVTGSLPASGDTAVAPGPTRLEVTFSRDLDPASSGWLQQTAEAYLELEETGFLDPRRAYADVVLQPSTTYAVWLYGFEGTNGIVAAPWLLAFRTHE
jgi:hypothetical protein